MSDWESWHFKFVIWMGSQFGEAGEILEWASTQEDTIGQEVLDGLELDHPRTKVFEFNAQLYGVLVSLFEMNSEPMELVRNSARGMGLDAWRRLCGKYDPSNPQTNLILLKRVLNPPRSTMEHLQSNLERWERELKQQGNPGGPVPQDVAALAGPRTYPGTFGTTWSKTAHILGNAGRSRSFD